MTNSALNYGARGTDTSSFDPAVRPQDDLFRHVNGRWIAATEIPADKARYGAFAVLAENAEAAVREIITGIARPDAGLANCRSEDAKIAGLYASFMDEERANQLGAQPIAADLQRALAARDIADVLQQLGELSRQGVSGCFGMFIDNDPGDPTRYIMFVTQGGIGLPDESYYRDAQFAQQRESYRAHIARMLHLAGVSADESAHLADLVFSLETRIAASHWDTVASRDIQKIYNLLDFAQLLELSDGFDWRHFIAAMGLSEQAFAEVVVTQPAAVGGLAALLVAEELPAWRAWLAWQIVRSAAALLSQEIAVANFEFYGTELTGVTAQRERWRRAVAFVEGAMGEAVGKRYVERHFDHAAKAAMDELVQHLISAYRESMGQLEWMGQATKERALEKLAKFTPKIAYPVKWRDYAHLQVDAGDLLGNARRVAEFEFAREVAKLGAPIDRDEWLMTPQTVNAYYNPGMNEIVFPAAILQPPFFAAEWDLAVNFGAIGAVIGHEIGHGFDDQGSRYDGDGLLCDWWTAADRDAFEQRTAKLIAQYNELSPEGAAGLTVNGELTIGENIGDLAGLEIAWQALCRALGATPAAEQAQQFFFSWARAWQQKTRPQEVVRLLTIDPHAPNEFRCNQIVRNLGAFHVAFGTQPGDALWLDPAARVSIW